MRYALPLLLTALVGCYSPRALAPGAYEADPFEQLDRPLEATLWFDEHTGYADFALSRPAHVAIFALRPGADLTMIYPARGMTAGYSAMRSGPSGSAAHTCTDGATPRAARHVPASSPPRSAAP